jgi:hypothetical protein
MTDRQLPLGERDLAMSMRMLQWDAAKLADMCRQNKAEREASHDGMSTMERGLMDFRAIYKEHNLD